VAGSCCRTHISFYSLARPHMTGASEIKSRSTESSRWMPVIRECKNVYDEPSLPTAIDQRSALNAITGGM
jgi:hypothetical protein